MINMMDIFLVGIAAVSGILIGFWLRGTDARAESVALEQRNRDIADALARTRAELEKASAESDARAGFETLAAEREKTMGQMSTEQERLRGELQAKGEAEKVHAARVGELEADLRHERQNMAEKVTLLETAKQALAAQFETVAADILEKKAKSFSEGSQAELGNLISPLREQLKDFRDKVEKVQIDSNSGVTKIETLIGSLGNLNQQLAAEARNLSTALRGSSKAQGDWGEFILRDLLEKAGLREGEQYSFQQSFSGAASENGDKRKSQRTDVIVNLPAGRHLVIDSKVSLNAYTDSVNAASEESRTLALQEHLKSVRNHMASLANAGYHHLPGIKSPDFVILFVPIEPAFLLALQNDPELWGDAYARNILLVGPTTLLYVIRIVSMLWHQEDQNRHVSEVMNHGAGLYAKFAAFINDMEDLGRSLRSASESYDEAKKKLSTGNNNLVRQVEKFRQLGVKPRLAKSARPIPVSWLGDAGVENGSLSLAAEGSDEPVLETEAEAEASSGDNEAAHQDHEAMQEELMLEEVPGLS